MTRSLCVVLLCLTGFAAARAQDDNYSDVRGTRVSNFWGKRYYFELKSSEMDKAPAWKSDAEFPPLPPRKARDIALAKAKALCPDLVYWHVELISLLEIQTMLTNPPSYWVYLIEFEGYRYGSYEGPPQILEIPVFMNGVVPEPRIEKQ